MSETSMSSAALHPRAGGRHPAGDLGHEHRVPVGMACFLCSEASFFGTLIVAYLTFLGHDKSGPTPAEALSMPLVIAGTVALVSSSFTVHFAGSALRAGRSALFHAWLLATIVLGALFLAGTAIEWRGLIYEHGLTIGRNLFGSTYFTLVGFHGLHVTIGALLLSLMFVLSLAGYITRERSQAFEMISWYWHFVDTVWIVVFLVVYVFGR